MHQIQIGVSQFKRENGSNINEKTAPQIDAVAKTEIRNTALYTIHNALNGGEISPEMLARWDQPRYKNGCESLLNMIPMPQGGITKRPGFEHIASLNSTRSHERLIPFIFSASNSRILEFHGSSSTTTAGLTIWFPGGQKYNAFSEDGKLPYKKEHIARLRVAQSYDIIYIAHPSYPPAKIMRESDGGIDASGDPVDQKWTYEVIKWTPDISAPSIFRIDMEGDPADGEKVQTTYKYRVTAIDAFTGEESLVSGAKSIKAYALSQTYYPRIIVDYPTDKIKPNGATEAGYAAEFRVYKYRGGVYGFQGFCFLRKLPHRAAWPVRGDGHRRAELCHRFRRHGRHGQEGLCHRPGQLL